MISIDELQDKAIMKQKRLTRLVFFSFSRVLLILIYIISLLLCRKDFVIFMLCEYEIYMFIHICHVENHVDGHLHVISESGLRYEDFLSLDVLIHRSM